MVTADTLVTITATSLADATQTASATILIGPLPGSNGNPPVGPTPSVGPASATVAPSGTQQFSVQNLAPGVAPNWSISPIAMGSISATGLYTAPNSVASQATVTVTATNSATSAVLGTASITLQASPSPSVSPATATVAPAGTKQFSVLNLPFGDTVTWSISPTTAGSISAAGLYTAPGDVAAQTTVTVTAKNSSTVLGTASITLQASPTPSVSPATATVAPAGTKQFSVLNLPTGDTVTWSISPTTMGSISAAGLYTAPSDVAAQTTITVTAKNSSTVLGTASITLQASPTPSVSPATATVAPAGTRQFSVLNLPSGDTVTWSISPTTAGSISAAGLYTAPGDVAAQTTVTVTAKNSSTVLGTASITLQASPTPSVSPATATVAPAGTKQFSVLNLPSGDTVTWSISPTTAGSISAAGLYTAPGDVAAQTTVTVTAKNSSTVLGTASITLQASPTPSVSPATATVAPAGTKQFSVLNLPTGDTVTWSISPTTMGSISAAGLYTAPSDVAAQTTITVTAKNSSTVLGTASITLQASPTPSVSPATATVAPAGTKQFSVLNLPSGDTVTWSISPTTMGSISAAGLYTAPSDVAAQTTITVTAKNSSTVLGTASITLQASPTPSVSPATATVAPAGAKQFSVLNLPSGDTVTWSLSPTTMGSISAAGLYTAPSNVASQTTITVTATNSSTVLGTASITLQASPSPSVSPATATVAPAGTKQFSVLNLPSGDTVTWSISPTTMGSISTGGLYSAPNSVASQTTVTVTAKNSSTVLGTASITLQVTAQSTAITLPIEVVGPNGTTSAASFTIPSGTNLSGQLKLWMQIHNLKYDTEASVQVNNSAWLPISTGNVTLLGNAAAFGGIGGGFHTLQLTLNLPAGAVITGTNTITFRFNATNDIVSGYRVLAFNVQSAGSNLLAASQFVNEDPNTWQPPLTDASDIAAGLALYQGASLTSPSSGTPKAIKAHCSDCHTIDGRDLKYFNYSNNSIQARATFHGLTAHQGNQIASYIRSLNVPNPGRPWNPPYQPGPGLDSQPVTDWSAGAGLDAVLESDAQMQPYLIPGGSTAGWSASSYVNPRELPITQQLPDWNSWLPTIHPMDGFGASFTTSSLNLDYPMVRAALVPNSQAAYKNALFQESIFTKWLEATATFLVPIETNATNDNTWGTNNLGSKVYSVAQWQLVKSWEINQEFGLEGMPQVPFGSKADVRGWFGNAPFFTAPDMLHIPPGAGIGDGSQAAKDYLTLAWFQVQLILNDGQGTQGGHAPIDYGYASAFVRNVFVVDAGLPGIMLELEWQVKALQEFTLTGLLPSAPYTDGWNPSATSMEALVDVNFMPLWSATSPATQTAALTAFTQAWFNQASKYTPQEYYAGGFAKATENPATLPFDTTFGGQVWDSLPRLRLFGVDASLTDQISAWAAKIWPLGNWNFNNTATCASVTQCTSGY